MTSGRVMTVAVVPGNTATIYVGSASGGVWKTTNGGLSWDPIFDREPGEGPVEVAPIFRDFRSPERPIDWLGG